MSGAWRAFVGAVRRRASASLGSFRRRESTLGWDAREPILFGVSLGFLAFGLIFPWWGYSVVTFDPVRGTKVAETFQFNPWLATHWYSVASFGGWSAEARPIPWWDFPRAYPQYAAYEPSLALLCAFWTAGFFLILLALWARAVPRRRFRGLPTFAGAGGDAFVAVSILLAYLRFPADGHFPTFAGGSINGPFWWGPGLGLYAAAVVVLFLTIAAWIGVRVDRKLKHVCWFCFRPVSGRACEYCKSRQ